MRADRLLSFLLLLQNRGRMTAAQLAVELEVSERTIYRDLEALSAAGIPVYADRGPGGGISLLDSYRTSLTGLTPTEARALLFLDIPEPLVRLGLGNELKTALQKVLAAAGQPSAPAPVILDWAGWRSSRQSAPFVPLLYQAVCQRRCVRITYRLPIGIEVERLVEPYGLVAKAGDWYLVSRGSGKLNLHRAADLTGAVLTEDMFDPSAHFDLEAYWKQCAGQIEAGFQQFHVRVRVAPRAVPHLEQVFGPPLRAQIQAAPTNPDGWCEVEICFESFEAARGHLLAYGSALEVLTPTQLRLSLLDYARQVEGVYSGE